MDRPREKGGRVVFIGNIPYGKSDSLECSVRTTLTTHCAGVSEEQICELFSSAGQVVNFRLVYDKETGRPKGFGFLEYTNADEAASAKRNLNNHEIMGRTLRVDYSNDNGGGGNRNDNQDQGGRDQQFDMGAQGGQPNGSDALPPLPQGTGLPDGLQATDAISRTLQQFSAPQLLDIISQMKGLCTSDQAKATTLLQQSPQLSYAIFQALLMLGLVDTNVIQSLVQQVPQAPPAQAPPPQQPPQHMPPMPYGQPPQMPPQYAQQPQYPPPQQYQYAPQPTPPVQHQAYQPPPQPQAPPQQAPPGEPDQQALIRQVMSMSREQIMGLDPKSRDQIIALRAQWGAPVS